jgi:hypothetical protein
MNVRVVLAEKIGEEPMVVEVEFERIFGGWLRNGVAKPLCRLFAAPGSVEREPRVCRVAEDRSSFRIHF